MSTKYKNVDPLYRLATRLVLTEGVRSVSRIQRELNVGYNRASKLMERMRKERLLPDAPPDAPPSGAGGMKYDDGKARFDLVPFAVLRGVAAVLEFGARKYSANSWQTVPEAFGRYRAAQERHWGSRVIDNETHCPDSHLEHAYHYACNALFLSWFMVFRPELVAAYAAQQNGSSNPECQPSTQSCEPTSSGTLTNSTAFMRG